tara:strand:- start:60 stop:305 length:246 start_codon:yes stop_codon:yes gene_type:complete
MDDFNHLSWHGFSNGPRRNNLMSKWIVGIMMVVVFAMFWKGIEVLGPSNTNKDVLYQGPEKTTEERWKSAFEWQKKRKGKE